MVTTTTPEAAMSDELSLTTDEIHDLADRLDASPELSSRDHEVLRGIFALAGAALATAQPEDEVSGFAMEAGPRGGAFESFQWAASPDAGKGKTGGAMFLHFNFKLVAVKTISW
jgi:hypothetical protein